MTRPAVSLPGLARWAGLGALATALLLTGGAPRPAHAAGMVVNTLADANPPLTDGLCSLREAITNANDNAATWPDCPAGAGADTITFSVSGTIVLAAGLPDISDGAGVVIDGSGRSVTVSGNNAARPLKINAGALAKLKLITIESGLASSGNGGGVLNQGTLAIESSSLVSNVAERSPGPGATGSGGGIANVEGILTITSSRLLSNRARTSGGAVYNTGELTVTDSEFAANESNPLLSDGPFSAGGAIANTGFAHLTRVRLEGNHVALGSGGAISNQGTLHLASSSLVGNSAGGFGMAGGTGGAVSNGGTLHIVGSLVRGGNSKYGGGIYNSGSLDLTNSTLAGNSTVGDTIANPGGWGSGLFNSAGTAVLRHVSVVGNSAPVQGGGIGIYMGQVIALNTIVSGNSAPSGPDCSSGFGAVTITLTGPNLIGDTTGCTITGTPPIVADPLLASLADNGGPTWTHALLPGSPALGAGDPAVCAAAPVSGLDQRGVARPQGAGCDLGAYEATPVGGKHLRVGAPAGGITLGWDSGFSQTGYTLLTYNTATASATLTNLPANAVAHTDGTVANGTVYCYVLAATGTSGVLGLSDLVCGLTGLEAGTVLPSGFTLSLHGTNNASLSWQAPTGGADSYLLVRLPLDGSAVTHTPLPGDATSSVLPVSAAGACFQLVAYKGAAYGLTNVVCGVPGISTLSSNLMDAALQEVAELVAGVVGHLPPLP